MSEPVDDTPAPDDDVETILDNEGTADEVARSLPSEGSDDDPGSMLNR